VTTKTQSALSWAALGTVGTTTAAIIIWLMLQLGAKASAAVVDALEGRMTMQEISSSVDHAILTRIEKHADRIDDIERVVRRIEDRLANEKGHFKPKR